MGHPDMVSPMPDEQVEPIVIKHPGTEYLGDGVYATFDGYQVWVNVDFDRIALELPVMENLIRYGRKAYGPNLGL
jgi:hypothetical protein